MTSTPAPSPPTDPDVVAAVSAAYDARAATYDESRMHRDLAVEVASFCALPDRRQSASGGALDVLDVATGTGLVLRALRSASAVALRLTGVDVSGDMLAAARRELPDATLLRADAATLPLADGSADLVTCVTALHLMPDPHAVLAEWARVLRPGGRAVTATFTGFAGPPRVRQSFAVHHDRFATPELLGAAAAQAGLRLRRHAAWRHEDGDAFLLCELAPAGPSGNLPASTPGP